MDDFRKISCVIQRGGTSKGIYLHEKDLPSDPKKREKIILAVFGSPDIRQIDGLGGADPLTSKCAIIGPSERPDADINYTMAQVGIGDALIDFRGNCGNISAGVGPFAVDEGLVQAQDRETIVRIYNTNTKKILKAYVATKNGKSVYTGDYSIDGGTGYWKQGSPRLFGNWWDLDRKNFTHRKGDGCHFSTRFRRSRSVRGGCRKSDLFFAFRSSRFLGYGRTTGSEGRECPG